MTTVVLRSRSASGLIETRRMMLETLEWQNQHAAHQWSPPADLYETETDYVIRVEAAGMRQQNFNISLQGRLLVVRGSRPDTPQRRAYHQMEIRFGEFQLAIRLPGQVDSEQAQAEYQDGFLVITLPKA